MNEMKSINALRNQMVTERDERYTHITVSYEVQTYGAWVTENVLVLPKMVWGVDEWNVFAEDYTLNTYLSGQLSVYNRLKEMGAPAESAYFGFKLKAKENADKQIYLQNQSKWIPRRLPRKLQFIDALVDYPKTGVMPQIRYPLTDDADPFVSPAIYEGMRGMDIDGDRRFSFSWFDAGDDVPFGFDE